MTVILAVMGGMMAFGPAAADSFNEVPPEAVQMTQASVHILASAFVSLGLYSTSTRSKAASAFVTLSDSWLDYYTIGFQLLRLERDDKGGSYFSQQLVPMSASRYLGGGTGVAVHYAFLREGEITDFSAASSFHFFGAGASHWFSAGLVAGSSFTLSLSAGRISSSAIRGGLSFHVGGGLWTTSSVITTKAEWGERLLSFRQGISVPLGNASSARASVVIGRRIFYFDDELLIIYNQREAHKIILGLGGSIRLSEAWFLFPSFEYNVFDGYRVFYGTVGIRAIL